MEISQAIILGVIQGITEFLPISSSGHLIFFPRLLGWVDQGIGFDVVVHLGTLCAVIVFFRSKIKILALSIFSRKDKINHKLVWYILLSIIPAGIVGVFFNDWIETTLRSTTIIGAGLIFWGLLLGIADKYMKKSRKIKNLEGLTIKDTILIACVQAIALVPGTSRSGITITAGLFSKLSKQAAAEFSFLMSIPIIALAGMLEIFKLFESGIGNLSIWPLFLGFISSFFAGFIAISGLLKIIQRWSFTPFVIYRIIIGILVLIYL